uniref:IDEAL domain-containing protein n=1 Tax=Rhabditophanes sp. KR3021 TaxID=114890 RepID=A0AC35UIC2_9BILA
MKLKSKSEREGERKREMPEISMLAIVIGHYDDKALILTHDFYSNDNKRGHLVVKEIDFTFKLTSNDSDEKSFENYEKVSNLENYKDYEVNVKIGNQEVQLTFLNGDDFDTLFEKMPEYV